MAEIDIKTVATRRQGDACRHIGQQVLPNGGRSLDGGSRPNTALASGGSIGICQSVWTGVLNGLATTMVSVGDKFHATATTVGAADQDAAGPYRQVEDAHPASIPGHGGRHYA